MAYAIEFSAAAAAAIRALPANRRAEVTDGIERHLRHEPTKTSRSRIKRLRGMAQPQYRLRLGDETRVFYDVTNQTVEVLAVVAKADAADWLAAQGTPAGAAGEDEG